MFPRVWVEARSTCAGIYYMCDMEICVLDPDTWEVPNSSCFFSIIFPLSYNHPIEVDILFPILQMVAKLGFPWWLSSKNLHCGTEDVGSVRVGKIPEDGNGNLLQNSCHKIT